MLLNCLHATFMNYFVHIKTDGTPHQNNRNKTEGLKKCRLLFPVRCGDVGVLSQPCGADAVPNKRLWEGGHRRLMGDCYWGERGAVTLHCRLTLAHTYACHSLWDKPTHTQNIQVYTMGLCVPSLISSPPLSLFPPSSCYILLLPLLLNLCYH